MYIGLNVKYPLFLADFNEISNFSTDFSKNPQSNFMKIRLMGAELFHEGEWKGRAEEQTNTTKLIVAFRNFANTPKHTAFCLHSVCV
jgi:hypothetical protein